MNSSSIGSAVPTIKCEDTSPSPTAPVGTEGEPGAYLSVNVNLSAAMMNLLAAENAGTTTLRTPEIVNDVITMTNPLDQYNYDKNNSFKVFFYNINKSAYNRIGKLQTELSVKTLHSPFSAELFEALRGGRIRAKKRKYS